MSIADEIAKLAALHDSGAISAEEFARGKARALGEEPGPAPGGFAFDSVRIQLRRSISDRWLGGVCGGLATYFGIDAWILRLLFFVFFFFAGSGVIPYVLLWIFVPSEADR